MRHVDVKSNLLVLALGLILKLRHFCCECLGREKSLRCAYRKINLAELSNKPVVSDPELDRAGALVIFQRRL